MNQEKLTLPFRMADTDVARRANAAAKETLHPAWHDYVADASHFKVEVYPIYSSGFGRLKEGVRVTHIVSGLFCECDSERNAHSNRTRAFDNLIRLLKSREIKPSVAKLAIPTKTEVKAKLDSLVPKETEWLSKAIQAITVHFANADKLVLSKNTWNIIVKGDPSEYDIVKLKEMLTAAGWENFAVMPPDYDNNATYIMIGF